MRQNNHSSQGSCLGFFDSKINRIGIPFLLFLVLLPSISAYLPGFAYMYGLNATNVTATNISASQICLTSGVCLGGGGFTYSNYFMQGLNASSNVTFYNITAIGNVSATNYYGNGSLLNGVCLSNGSNCVQTVYYNVSTVKTTGGQNLSDNNTLLMIYDDLSYNITEGNGGSPLDFYANFTGVSKLSGWVTREYYIGSSSHNILFQIWDYNTNDWESYYGIVGQSGFTIINFPVLDSSTHISAGLVQTRLHHVENGISSHELRIDYMWLYDGNPSSASINLDGYARYQYGQNSFNGTGNIATKNISLTGNITITDLTSCIYAPGGGRLCGNSTCIILYSPNGLSSVQSCN